LLLNVNKGGYMFINDRATGEFVAGYPTVKNINWIQGVDGRGNLIGRNEPEVGKTKRLCPSIGGGRSWNQASYSPQTGLLYNTALEWCQDVVSVVEDPKEGQVFFGGTFVVKPTADGTAYGHLDAHDPVTGKVKWSYRAKYPILASVLSTAGGLVFAGDPDGYFFALDASTGDKLWSFQTGSGHRGSSISYAAGGRQFVATPSGWGSALAGLFQQMWPETERIQGGSAIFAFTLPEEKQ
jgi:alcohol dehydrogenase (cytochrome c)